MPDAAGLQDHLLAATNDLDRLQRLQRLLDDASGTLMGHFYEAVVEQAPTRLNPVTQDEMDAGSVELF